MSVASEKKLRVMANEMVGDKIKAEMGALTFPHGKGEEIRDAPFAYCPNLISKVSDMVCHHERQAVCVHKCVCVCVHDCVPTCVCACVWGGRDKEKRLLVSLCWH